jgi:PIN domain nuclease of toxin-antitoxin system
MRILLDTQAWLWMESRPDRFSTKVRKQLVHPQTELFLSTASIWEISIKFAMGKLELPLPPAVYVPDRMARNNISALAIETAHALGVIDLPQHHRDPFDRMLVSQARVEQLPILTSDPAFEKYDIEVIRP